MEGSKKRWIVRGLWLASAAVVVFLLVRAFGETAVLVDTDVVAKRDLVVTVDDDGRTRVRERYSISAPIQGRLLRTSLRPGDVVERGKTTVAEFAPTAPEFLDARSKEQAEARLRRSEAALAAAQARRRQAEVDLRQSQQDLTRTKGLDREGLESKKRREAAENAVANAREGMRAAEFAEQVARYERDLARASLRQTRADDVVDTPVADTAERVDANGRLRLKSPIDGTVLRVFEESARALVPGTPILEVGNTERLEIVADFLSQDAVRVRPGMIAKIDGWSGDAEDALEARVRVVEPGGFTKVSALGVEEQRVNILMDPTGQPQLWAKLGDGYHVDVRIVTWEAKSRLTIPTGALFRSSESWMAYFVEEGRARLRTLRIGRNNGLYAEVLEGAPEGARVVLYPNDLLSDGCPIESR